MKKRQVGVIKDWTSPVMGSFYEELSRRVAKSLKDQGLARRPFWGKVMLFVLP